MDDPRSEIASSKVLKTYELVGQILTNLWLKDLLHAKQVCTHWNDVVNRSTRLRPNLFLEPQDQTYIRGEPFIAGQVSKRASIGRRDSTGRVWYMDVAGVEDVKFNPCLLCDEDHDFRVIENREWVLVIMAKDYERMCNLPKGQWQAMLVTQPVTSALMVASYPCANKSFRNEDGINMGEVVEYMEQVWQESMRQIPVYPDELLLSGRLK